RAAAGAQAAAGRFGRLARLVQRRPVLVAVGTGAALLAAGIPFLSVNYGSGDPRLLPASFESRQVTDTLLARFPGEQADPVQVVARVPATDPRVQAYARQIQAMPAGGAVSGEALPGSLCAVDAVPPGSSQGATARRLVTTLRDNRPGYPTDVTGSAAFLMDFEHQIASRLPWAVGLIALATFVLLFLMTGSVLVPL